MSPALLALVSAAALAAEPPRPGTGALRRAAEAGGRAVVQVRATGASPGVLVGAEGQVLVPAWVLRGDSALVDIDGRARPARLVTRLPGFGLALIVAEGDGPFQPPPARVERAVAGEWIVGVGPTGTPLLGRVSRAQGERFFDVSLALARGTPVLDGSGRLLGVVTGRRPNGARAASVPAIHAELHGGGLAAGAAPAPGAPEAKAP